MNKRTINEFPAKTEADINSTAQNQQVSQPNANTNVVGSRLIKFKSWDLAEKCFVKLNGISFHTNEAVVELFGINTIVDLSKLQLIQYTGLKDKNGKEIYEGDIMCWDKYQNTRHDVRWVVEIIPTRPTKSWSQSNNKEDAIVIGNIFENPELLETLR